MPVIRVGHNKSKGGVREVEVGGRGRGQIFCSFLIFWVKCQEAHTRFSNQIIIITCVSSNYPAKLVLNSFPASVGQSV